MAERLLKEVYLPDIALGDSRVLFCGVEQCIPRTDTLPHIRSHFLMVFIVSGKGIFRNPTATYHLGAGATFCVFPGELVFYKEDAEDPWTYYWIGFSGGEVLQILHRASISPHRPVHIANDIRELEALYASVVSYSTRLDFSDKLKIQSLLYDILYHYARSVASPDALAAISTNCSQHIVCAVDYIKSHYQTELSVAEVARAVGISREYFCMLFKRQFSISPVRYIREYRLKTASMLLLTTRDSIAVIAEKVGFHDYNYFTNQFTRHFGVSPTGYRKAGLDISIKSP